MRKEFILSYNGVSDKLIYENGKAHFEDYDYEDEIIAYVLSGELIPKEFFIKRQLIFDSRKMTEIGFEALIAYMQRIAESYEAIKKLRHPAFRARPAKNKPYTYPNMPLSLALDLAWRYGQIYLQNRKDIPNDVRNYMCTDPQNAWPYTSLKEHFAIDKKTPIKLLLKMLDCKDADVLVALAKNPNLPNSAREVILSRDAPISSSFVRQITESRVWAIKGWQGPLTIKETAYLATSQHELIRRAIASKQLSPGIASRLSLDSSIKVRTTLARNKYLTDEIKIRLAKDHSITVQRALMRQKELPEIATKYLRHLIARNERLMKEKQQWRKEAKEYGL